MSRVLAVAGKELREGSRNRWVVATTLLLAGLALTLGFLGSAPSGTTAAGALDVLVVSLSSLTIFLLPLIALLLAHDAIVGEVERGTMLLMLSHPLARWEIVLGKFLGQSAIIALATLLGYGAAAVAVAALGEATGGESWLAFAQMIASSVLLGASFVAIGHAVSALAGDRGTAAGVAIGVWLLLVLLFDLALLGALVADQGRVLGAASVTALLLLNPTDVYRLLNLTASAEVSSFAGMAGLAGALTPDRRLLVLVLVAWMLLPLALAMLVFSRREI